ncbi:Putative gypsy type transposon [Musa troglodytarum]|uniref:Gypsy type transposon n=1 Tax=Musa troglodytarum TaxID=320322 RepID=A0A9E7GSR1_9LILI|nr:Putative gypsy type transposon [Musa troglodytarum]
MESEPRRQLQTPAVHRWFPSISSRHNAVAVRSGPGPPDKLAETGRHVVPGEDCGRILFVATRSDRWQLDTKGHEGGVACAFVTWAGKDGWWMMMEVLGAFERCGTFAGLTTDFTVTPGPTARGPETGDRDHSERSLRAPRTKAGRMLRPTPPTPKSKSDGSDELRGCPSLLTSRTPRKCQSSPLSQSYLFGLNRSDGGPARRSVGAVVNWLGSWGDAEEKRHRRGDDVIRGYGRRPGPLLRDNLEGGARKNLVAAWDLGSGSMCYRGRRRSRPGKPMIEEARDPVAELPFGIKGVEEPQDPESHSHRTVVRDIVPSRRSRPRMPMIEPSLKIMYRTAVRDKCGRGDARLPFAKPTSGDQRLRLARPAMSKSLLPTRRWVLGVEVTHTTWKTMIAELPFGMYVCGRAAAQGLRNQSSRTAVRDVCGRAAAQGLKNQGSRTAVRYVEVERRSIPLPADVRNPPPSTRRFSAKGRGHAHDLRDRDGRISVRDEGGRGDARYPLPSGHASGPPCLPTRRFSAKGRGHAHDLRDHDRGRGDARYPLPSGRPEVRGRDTVEVTPATRETMIAEPTVRDGGVAELRSRLKIPMKAKIAESPGCSKHRWSSRSGPESQNSRIAGMCGGEPRSRLKTPMRIAGMCVASALKAQNTMVELRSDLESQNSRIAGMLKIPMVERRSDLENRRRAAETARDWAVLWNRFLTGVYTRRLFINMICGADRRCDAIGRGGGVMLSRPPFSINRELRSSSLTLPSSSFKLVCDGSSFHFLLLCFFLLLPISYNPRRRSPIVVSSFSPSSDVEAARALESLNVAARPRLRLGWRMVGILVALQRRRNADPVPKGFATTADALEAGLRLPLHPVIVACISLWRISPSQITPNSWRYLVVFLGECHYANIAPTRNLFLSCFRLFKGSGGYFLAARPGFRVSGAPTNNKGWKRRFFFVQCQGDWGPSTTLLGRVPRRAHLERRIKSALGVGRRWMVNLRSFHDSGAPRGPSPRSPAVTKRAGDGSPRTVEEGRQKKRARSKDMVDLEAPAAMPAGASERPGTSPSAERAGPRQGATGRGQRPPSMQDLCRGTSGKGEPFLSRMMGRSFGQRSDPLVARWHGLSRGDKVWVGGEPSARYLRGALHPDMARDLYTLPSEALLAKSAKSVLWGLHYTTALLDRVHDCSERNLGCAARLEEARAGRDPRRFFCRLARRPRARGRLGGEAGLRSSSDGKARTASGEKRPRDWRQGGLEEAGCEPPGEALAAAESGRAYKKSEGFLLGWAGRAVMSSGLSGRENPPFHAHEDRSRHAGEVPSATFLKLRHEDLFLYSEGYLLSICIPSSRLRAHFVIPTFW